MYLSRVEIDLYNRQKIKELSHLGAYHNWVEQLFPEEMQKQVHSRKLWRIDELQGRQYLMVLSEKQPNKEAFDLYGVKNTGQIKSYESFLNQLQAHQEMRFRATLNPVTSKSSGKSSGQRGRVIPCFNILEQMEYLKKRSEKNGFGLQDEEFAITQTRIEILRKKKEKPISLLKSTYEGILTIHDIEKFKIALTQGIGRKKAYGCGLLTVIPLS